MININDLEFNNIFKDYYTKSKGKIDDKINDIYDKIVISKSKINCTYNICDVTMGFVTDLLIHLAQIYATQNKQYDAKYIANFALAISDIEDDIEKKYNIESNDTQPYNWIKEGSLGKLLKDVFNLDNSLLSDKPSVSSNGTDILHWSIGIYRVWNIVKN